jgi:hypothetical protein
LVCPSNCGSATFEIIAVKPSRKSSPEIKFQFI